MATEIERKFLITEIPDWLPDHESEDIRQGYLAISEEEEVRVRKTGDSPSLTIKRGHGQSREEVEVEVTEQQFSDLWPVTEGQRVHKRRLKVPLDGGLTAEVDVYEGSLEGLCVVEVEFEDEGRAGEFEAPGWFGKEVTGNDRFTNQTLAVKGFPEDTMPGAAAG